MSNMKLIMERFNNYVTEQESPIDRYAKLEKELEARMTTLFDKPDAAE